MEESLVPNTPLTLEVDVDSLLSHWRWFGEWSLGCIGVLGDWLVETVDDLYKRGETTLTIEALERHALQPDQRARIEMEARTGEHKVELGKTKGEEDLKRLLGNPAPLPSTTPLDQSANGVSDLSASPDQAVRTGSKTRIERAATRDLVKNGEDSQMPLYGSRRDRNKAFSGEWPQAGGMPPLSQDSLALPAQWCPPVSIS